MLSTSRLRRLAQGGERNPVPDAPELCDLCGEPITPEHRHLLDLEERKLLCACRACSILFDRKEAGGRRYRLIPERRRRLEDFVLSDAQWERLRVPVDIAFFHYSSAVERVVAFYPGAMGPVESLLELEAWSEMEAANPVLREMEPDVEALLVSRVRGAREHWLVPVDDCYRLVGLIRTHWKGFGGGGEVWREIERFFGELAGGAAPGME